MRNSPATPVEMIASPWRDRDLIHALAKREVLGRYRGSIMGLLWSFFNPVLMLAVYTFVFSEVFKARWSAESSDTAEFALLLFAGLIVFNLFAECINRAPGLVLANVNYVKKVVFPLEILPLVALISALYHTCISLGVWLVAYMALRGMPQPTTFLLPLIILPFGFLIMGVSWVLASLGVYLRDIGQVIGVLVTALMFLSPVFYPETALPEQYRGLLHMNPLTPAIGQVREVLYFGRTPDFAMLGVYWAVTLVIAWIGFAWFQKTRKGFADVL